MSWEIVVGLITLVGFIGSIGVWISKLTRTLTALECTLKALQETLNSMKTTNEDEHTDIYNTINRLTDRIRKLELFVQQHHSDSGLGSSSNKYN